MEQVGRAASTSSTRPAKRRKRSWRKLFEALSAANLARSAVAVDMDEPYARRPYQSPKRSRPGRRIRKQKQIHWVNDRSGRITGIPQRRMRSVFIRAKTGAP